MAIRCWVGFSWRYRPNNWGDLGENVLSPAWQNCKMHLQGIDRGCIVGGFMWVLGPGVALYLHRRCPVKSETVQNFCLN